jgi:hypothetical protein
MRGRDRETARAERGMSGMCCRLALMPGYPCHAAANATQPFLIRSPADVSGEPYPNLATCAGAAVRPCYRGFSD